MRERSSYPKLFEAQVVQGCLQPSAAVSSVAICHGVTANVIRKWLPLGNGGADHQNTAWLDVGSARTDAQRIGHGLTPRLQPETLGSADAPTGRWGCAHRQQPGRNPDTAMGTWALELVVCRIAAQP